MICQRYHTRIFPHVVVYGGYGCGKTSLINRVLATGPCHNIDTSPSAVACPICYYGGAFVEIGTYVYEQGRSVDVDEFLKKYRVEADYNVVDADQLWYVVPGNFGVSHADMEMLGRLISLGESVRSKLVIVINKSDAVSASSLSAIKGMLEQRLLINGDVDGPRVVVVSAMGDWVELKKVYDNKRAEMSKSYRRHAQVDKRVFVSYSSYDKSFVDGWVWQMEECGIVCWYAPRDVPIGNDYAAEIPRAIEASDFVLLMASKASYASKQCCREIAIADDCGKVILPIRLDDATPCGDMAYRLQTCQYVEIAVDGRDGALARIWHRIVNEKGIDNGN